MATRAKHRQKPADGGDGMATRLCSITSTGLVFLAARRLDVSSEVTLSVQTGASGAAREWEVHGWVVDCRSTRCRDGLRYRVTLLFHDLPVGLQGILTGERVEVSRKFPPLPNAALFGLN